MTKEALACVSQLAYALAVLGDRWTLLIMRELRMGVNCFEAIQAQTGMSSHLLRNRLRQMESDGLIDRRLYNDHPPRYKYDGTAMGKDLDSVILALRNWSLKWGPWKPGTPPAVTMIYGPTGTVINGNWRLPEGTASFSFDHVIFTLSEEFLKERQERAANLREKRGRWKKIC